MGSHLEAACERQPSMRYVGPFRSGILLFEFL
jgi:hypothetical protein